MTVRNESVPRNPIHGLPDTQDQLFGMVTTLATQLAVTRERLDTLERLVQSAGVIEPGAVEAYKPDAEAQKERDTIRQTLIVRIFRPVQEASARTARMLKGEGQ